MTARHDRPNLSVATFVLLLVGTTALTAGCVAASQVTVPGPEEGFEWHYDGFVVWHFASGAFPSRDGIVPARFIAFGSDTEVVDTVIVTTWDYRLVFAVSQYGCPAGLDECSPEDLGGWLWPQVPEPWLGGATLLWGQTLKFNEAHVDLPYDLGPNANNEWNMTVTQKNGVIEWDGPDQWRSWGHGWPTHIPRSFTMDPSNGRVRSTGGIDLIKARQFEAMANWRVEPDLPPTESVSVERGLLPEDEEPYYPFSFREAWNNSPEEWTNEAVLLLEAWYIESKDPYPFIRTVDANMTRKDYSWHIGVKVSEGEALYWVTGRLDPLGMEEAGYHHSSEVRREDLGKIDRTDPGRLVYIDRFSKWAESHDRAPPDWIQYYPITAIDEDLMGYEAVWDPWGAHSLVSVDASTGSLTEIEGDPGFLADLGFANQA